MATPHNTHASKLQQEDSNPGSLDRESDVLIATVSICPFTIHGLSTLVDMLCSVSPPDGYIITEGLFWVMYFHSATTSVRLRARARVCVCVRACVRAYGYVHVRA